MIHETHIFAKFSMYRAKMPSPIENSNVLLTSSAKKTMYHVVLVTVVVVVSLTYVHSSGYFCHSHVVTDHPGNPHVTFCRGQDTERAAILGVGQRAHVGEGDSRHPWRRRKVSSDSM